VIVITGVLVVAPERIDELRPHIATLVAASRRDPGCLLYAWAEDFLEPGAIRMTEHWDSLTAFQSHDRSSHAEAWKAALGKVGLLRREMWLHHVASSEMQ
jgi:quinol monooxygenase YgiN